MFYETHMKGVEKERYIEVGRAALLVPFVYVLGFRTVADLTFIAEEARAFSRSCFDQFGVAPKITFV